MPEQAQTVGSARANERQADTTGANTGRNSNRLDCRSNGTWMQNEFEINTPDIGGIMLLPAETHIKAKVKYTKF